MKINNNPISFEEAKQKTLELCTSNYALKAVENSSNWDDLRSHMFFIDWLTFYSKYVIKGRWPEVEKYILEDERGSFFYAKEVIGGRWPEMESRFIKNFSENSFLYARDVIGARWPEMEKCILKDERTAFLYARDVVGGRWPEAEKRILSSDNAYVAFLYSTEVIGGRWPEAESIIKKEFDVAADYDFFVKNTTKNEFS